MIKFLIIIVLSLAITKILHVFFDNKKTADHADKKEIIYKIIPSGGVVGCLSRDLYKQMSSYYKKKEYKKIRKMINDKSCFVFQKDEEVIGTGEICNKNNTYGDVFMFSTKKFIVGRIFLPCYAIVPSYYIP